jgi:hypothetical protein
MKIIYVYREASSRAEVVSSKIMASRRKQK